MPGSEEEVASLLDDYLRRLAALAHERGKTIGEVLVELVREAA